MSTKASQRFLLLWSTLAVAGGCGQILGISDYEVDPKLGGNVGGEGGEGGKNTTAGKSGIAGIAGIAGEPGEGGTGGTGGVPVVVVGGNAGEAGAGQAGAGAVGPGTLVPCDSADCCSELGGTAVGVELLKDGGFELGPVSDGDSPWTQLSTNGEEIITNDPEYGFDPKSGDYYAYLSGIQGERSTLYTETITVPSDAGWLVVSGYRLFQVDLQDGVNEDFCGIGFYEVPPGDALEIPFYWSAPENSTDGWGDTPNWKRFEGSWDATPHQGAKRRLGLVGESDAYPAKADVAEGESTSSSYLFDDVSLKVFRCYQ